MAGLVRGMALIEPGFAINMPGPVRVGRVRLPADPIIDRAIDKVLRASELEVVDIHKLIRRAMEICRDETLVAGLHVLTEKGHGVPQASEDPVTYHTPPVFEKVGPERNILSLRRGGSKAYTDSVSAAIHQAMRDDPHLRDGLNVSAGRITHPVVAEALGQKLLSSELAVGG